MRARLAILSATGTARKRTIPAIRERDICDIIAIHGRDDAKLQALAEQFSIPQIFTDPAEMLDRVQPDFAFIASPPILHLEQIKLCAERRIPVLCEKPLSLTSQNANDIGALVVKHGIPFRVAHHLRHQPGVRRLRDLISEGSLGQLHRASMQWAFWLNDAAPNALWKLSPETGGPNAFYDAGIHTIDLMLHLLPPPSTIVALGRRSRFVKTTDNVAALALCGETLVEISASQSVRHPCNDLILDFEEATIRVEQAFGEKPFARMDIFGEEHRTEKFEAVNPYGEEVADFIQLLNGGHSFGTTLDEARLGVKVMESIAKSSETKRAISIEE